jgi:starch phosphorylase
MLEEYMRDLYEPAHRLWGELSMDNFAAARRRSVWEEHVRTAWNQVRFVELDSQPTEEQVMSGSSIPVRATLELGGLQSSEVRVEAVIGQVGGNGQLHSTVVVPLKPVSQDGTKVTFANEFTVQQTGRVGYSVRISPDHFDNPLTRPCNALLKWVSDENVTGVR